MKRLLLVSAVFFVSLSLISCANSFKSPFKALPPEVQTYEGIGISKNRNIKIAMNEAYVQAMGIMALNVYRIVSADLTEIIVRDKVLNDQLTKLSVQLPLPGKVFREDKYEDGIYWTRVYMAKSEVDKNLSETLSDMNKGLLEETEKALRKRISGTDYNVERDLRVLSELTK